jgi:hypothetical protein
MVRDDAYRHLLNATAGPHPAVVVEPAITARVRATRYAKPTGTTENWRQKCGT